MSYTANKLFFYNIPWKSNSIHLGDHLGTQRGIGHDYRGNVSLVDYPDIRRMDVRQTLQDPFEQIQIRTFNQENTTPVYAVVDLSSSMQFTGEMRKLDKAMEIGFSIAFSAYQAGDICGVVSYADRVIEEYSSTASQHLTQNIEILSRLASFKQRNLNSAGLLDVPFYLSQKRSLVFWISDFHMPLDLLEKSLNAMSIHQVVPVVLWEDREYSSIPTFGFGNLIDPENGSDKTVFFRKSLRDKFINAFEQRRITLESLFLKFDYPPLFLEEEYSADVISNYFEQYISL